MTTSSIAQDTVSVITSTEWLEHWMGHRRLTRKVIAAFPEKEFFEYSIGGMRPFAALIGELLAIAVPGLKQMVEGEVQPMNDNFEKADTKEKVLALWDEATEQVNDYWHKIPENSFHESILLFGQYPGTIQSSIFYMIDNEIHHRAQGYVYLRALGVQPPFFWER